MMSEQLTVTVLGSGSAIQFENRASASYLVDTGEYRILLDAGFSVMDRLERAGVRAETVDAVFLSHRHPDHVAGLVHLLFALKNPHHHRDAPIRIFGFDGVKDYLNLLKVPFGSWIDPPCGVEVFEARMGTVAGCGYSLFATDHAPDSVGIVLRAREKRIVYTGDAGFELGLRDVFAGADLVIVDCGSGRDAEHDTPGHMSFSEIEQLVTNNGISSVLVSHFYPESEKPAKSRAAGGTRVILARDLLTLHP